MSHSYDVIKPLNKQITCDYGALIIALMAWKFFLKIDQEMREL